MTEPRFLIGIDLGTTSCALSYMDRNLPGELKTLPIVQWETETTVVERPLLPSFCYALEKSQRKRSDFLLPFESATDPSRPTWVVGRFAQKQAVENPQRTIHSAKSWLAHGGLERRSAILPWHSQTLVGVNRLSPVEVSARYLAHLAGAWNAAMASQDPTCRIEHQSLTITVPASFDEVACLLTLEAAELAGLPAARIRLVEEPLAAFYYWLWEQQRQDPSLAILDAEPQLRTLLICDIGGGTSDFSWFSLARDPEKGCQLERAAVSEHLLLGGDNIDLQIASLLEKKRATRAEASQTNGALPSDSPTTAHFSPAQWAFVYSQARELKETAFQTTVELDTPLYVSIPAVGRDLFGAVETFSLTPREIRNAVIEGFFPFCTLSQHPLEHPLGLRQLGLPYAYDSAITHHLANFVATTMEAGRSVDGILFAGGTLVPPLLQARLLEVIATWQGGKQPVLLCNSDLILSISKGAACWQEVIAPQTRIEMKSGYPRSLYLAIETEGTPKGLCIVEKGETSHRPVVIALPGLQAVVNQSVQFHLYASRHRHEDRRGEIVPLTGLTRQSVPLLTRLDIQTTEVAPIEVLLEVCLQENGLLSLTCMGTGPQASLRWPLEFQVEDATQAMLSTMCNEENRDRPAQVQAFSDQLREAFQGIPPSGTKLLRAYEERSGISLASLPLSQLRELGAAALPFLKQRTRSPQHEAASYSLLGYLLRPGWGDPLDATCLQTLWKLAPQCYAKGVYSVGEQWWILCRRVSGGLSALQQEAHFGKLWPLLRARQGSPEQVKLAGALERLEMNKKIQLGNFLVEQILRTTPGIDAYAWALARVASRVLLHGEASHIVPAFYVEGWINHLMGMEVTSPKFRCLAPFFFFAGRKCLDREFDVGFDLQERLVRKMQKETPGHPWIESLSIPQSVTADWQEQLFGESLPLGLQLK